jgi:hypothetical protein
MVIGIVSAVSLAALIGATAGEKALWAGTFLEIAGLAKVAWDLHQIRKTYNRPSIVNDITTWFRDVPSMFHRPKPVTISLSASGVVTMSGRATLTVIPAPGSPVERRLEILESEMSRLRDQITKDHTELTAQIHKVETSVTAERNDRGQAQEVLQRKVADLAVGGLHLEMVGLVWLFVGVILSTLPERVVAALWEQGATILRAVL